MSFLCNVKRIWVLIAALNFLLMAWTHETFDTSLISRIITTLCLLSTIRIAIEWGLWDNKKIHHNAKIAIIKAANVDIILLFIQKIWEKKVVK